MELQESVFFIVTDTVWISGFDVGVLDVGPSHSNANSDIIWSPPKFNMYFSPELLRQFMTGFRLAKQSLMTVGVVTNLAYVRKPLHYCIHKG